MNGMEKIIFLDLCHEIQFEEFLDGLISRENSL